MGGVGHRVFRALRFGCESGHDVETGRELAGAGTFKRLERDGDGLPCLLVFLGGAIGGLFGGISIAVNGRIFRSEMNELSKFLVTGMVSAAAVFFYILVIVMLGMTLGPIGGKPRASNF